MEEGELQAASPRSRPRQALRWAEHLAQRHFSSLGTQPCSPLDQWHGVWSLHRSVTRCVRHKDEVPKQRSSLEEEEEDGDRDGGSSSGDKPPVTPRVHPHSSSHPCGGSLLN